MKTTFGLSCLEITKIEGLKNRNVIALREKGSKDCTNLRQDDALRERAQFNIHRNFVLLPILKACLSLSHIAFLPISRSPFRQSQISLLFSLTNVLRLFFCKFWVILDILTGKRYFC